jgi:hypothetical protein
MEIRIKNNAHGFLSYAFCKGICKYTFFKNEHGFYGTIIPIVISLIIPVVTSLHIPVVTSFGVNPIIMKRLPE